MSREKVEVTVSNRTILRVILLTVVGFLAVYAFKRVTSALTLIFVAFFLALALNAPVHWIALHLPGKKRGSRTLATAVAFFVVVLGLGAFLTSIVPPLINQVTHFIESVPKLVNDLYNPNTTLGGFVARYDLYKHVDTLGDQANSWAASATGGAVGTIGKVGTSLVSAVTVLVLTFMMLIEGPRWIRLARRLTPNRREAHFETLARSMYKVVKGYVNGQVLLAAIAAVLIIPVLLVMNVGYPWALMVLVFICGLVPMVGHTIGAVLVSLVALFTSPVAALVVFIYYVLYQQIENAVVQPKIQSNSTDMSPLLVFTSVIIGVGFGGILGGLVAIPVAGCLRILVLDYLNRKRLLDKSELDNLEIITTNDVAKQEKMDKKIEAES